MIMELLDLDFMESQEEEYQDDIEEGTTARLDRNAEFVSLRNDDMEEIMLSLKGRDLFLAHGVLRCVINGTCPPLVRISRLGDEEMTELIALKQKGNQNFVAGKYQAATDAYEEALISLITCNLFILPSHQMEELVNILSNQAECELRLHQYNDAAQTATDALQLDADHEKTRIRRAKAELALYKEQGGLSYLAQACFDLECVLTTPGSSTLATETARTLLSGANVLIEQERERSQEENPDSNFQLRVRFLKSTCW